MTKVYCRDCIYSWTLPWRGNVCTKEKTYTTTGDYWEPPQEETISNIPCRLKNMHNECSDFEHTPEEEGGELRLGAVPYIQIAEPKKPWWKFWRK